MNPQHKEQMVNALEVRSIEDDVLQNKADISDLRSADKNFDVRLTQAISTISSINTTIHGEMDNLSGKISSLEELSSGLQEEVDVVEANLGELDGRLSQAEELGSGLQEEVGEIDVRLSKAEELGSGLQEEVGEIDVRLSKAEKRTAVCGYQERL